MISIGLGILWFPFRLFLDEEDPVATVVATSGLYGFVWALFTLTSVWMSRRVRPNKGAQAPVEKPRDIRRGALAGLGVGVIWYGGLLGFCIVTGRPVAYFVGYSWILFAVITVAAVRLRKAQRGGASA